MADVRFTPGHNHALIQSQVRQAPARDELRNGLEATCPQDKTDPSTVESVLIGGPPAEQMAMAESLKRCHPGSAPWAHGQPMAHNDSPTGAGKAEVVSNGSYSTDSTAWNTRDGRAEENVMKTIAVTPLAGPNGVIAILEHEASFLGSDVPAAIASAPLTGFPMNRRYDLSAALWDPAMRHPSVQTASAQPTGFPTNSGYKLSAAFLEPAMCHPSVQTASAQPMGFPTNSGYDLSAAFWDLR